MHNNKRINDNDNNTNNKHDITTTVCPFTPGLHNKIPALKIFARGWLAQICLFHW